MHYPFVTRDEFQRLLDNDAFVEHGEYKGNLYGTIKRSVSSYQQPSPVANVRAFLTLSTHTHTHTHTHTRTHTRTHAHTHTTYTHTHNLHAHNLHAHTQLTRTTHTRLFEHRTTTLPACMQNEGPRGTAVHKLQTVILQRTPKGSFDIKLSGGAMSKRLICVLEVGSSSIQLAATRRPLQKVCSETWLLTVSLCSCVRCCMSRWSLAALFLTPPLAHHMLLTG